MNILIYFFLPVLAIHASENDSPPVLDMGKTNINKRDVDAERRIERVPKYRRSLNFGGFDPYIQKGFPGTTVNSFPTVEYQQFSTNNPNIIQNPVQSFPLNIPIQTLPIQSSTITTIPQSFNSFNNLNTLNPYDTLNTVHSFNPSSPLNTVNYAPYPTSTFTFPSKTENSNEYLFEPFQSQYVPQPFRFHSQYHTSQPIFNTMPETTKNIVPSEIFPGFSEISHKPSVFGPLGLAPQTFRPI